jgi:CubicO group peptidase (beta-lactamase class C family)
MRRFSFLFIMTGLLFSPSIHADQVDTYIKLRMDKEHLPGLSLAVLRDGKIIKLKGYGYANLELKVPASPGTVYQVGSITKQFTATAILILVQENIVGLDDKIGKYLNGTPEAWKEITVRNLLTHTSGLQGEGIPTTDKTMAADFTEEDMFKSAIALPMLSPPGVKYAYSNLDYNLLAIIVEKVSGKTYADFLQERIFQPLDMTSTRVNDRGAIISNRAQAFLWNNGSLQICEPQVSPTRYLGSGSILSTVSDLAKWDAALYTDRILTATSLKMMWTPTKLADGTFTDYGFGWVISSVKKHADIHHNGAMNGFVGNISRFADDRLTVIVLVNQSGLSNTERIATGVARIYIPAIRPTLQGNRLPLAKVDPAVYAAFAGHYDYYSGFMLTLTTGSGVLLGQLPVGEADDYVPVSATSFWQAEEGIQLTLAKNASGEVTGLLVRQDDGTERAIPRIGPLFNSLAPRADPDPNRTQQMVDAMKAMAQGGKAVEEEASIAAGGKRDFVSGSPDVEGLKSLSYIAVQDVADRSVERHGEKVSRILYYRMATDKSTRYLLLYLTADGLLTDYDIVDN